MTPKEWKSELQSWRSPLEFRYKLQELRSEYKDRLLTEAGLTDMYRDAYPASVFALLRGAERVRLIEACQPDFEVEVLGYPQKYEIVEADTPGRKRSDEIRNQPSLQFGEPIPESYYLTPELAPKILERAAKRKDKNCYLYEWVLLIYLNPCRPHGPAQQEIEEGMVQATAAAKDRFAEVWVLWEDTAYNTWRSGAPANSVLRPSHFLDEAEEATSDPNA